MEHAKPIDERRSRDFSILNEFGWRCLSASIIFALFLYVPALFVLAAASIEFTNTALIVTGACILLLAAIPVIALNRKILRQLRTQILVFPDKIVRVRTRESVAYPWAEIQEFYEWGICHDHLTHVEIDRHYRVRHCDGHSFEFSEKLHSKEDLALASHIEKGLIECQLPHLWERFFNRHETIAFGPLALEPQGFRYKSAFLPWREADYVWTDDGKVRVRRRGKLFNWCTVKAEKVPNICLLIALAKAKIAKEE